MASDRALRARRDRVAALNQQDELLARPSSKSSREGKARKDQRTSRPMPSNDDEPDRDQSVWLELTLIAIILTAGTVSGVLAFLELLNGVPGN
jgi:hypothetical protein